MNLSKITHKIIVFFFCVLISCTHFFVVASEARRKNRQKVRELLLYARGQAKAAHEEFNQFFREPRQGYLARQLLAKCRKRFKCIDTIKPSFLVCLKHSWFDNNEYWEHYRRFGRFWHQMQTNVMVMEGYLYPQQRD